MKEVKKYIDIVRYGKSNTKEVLKVGDYISISEKIDGANAQFSVSEELEIFCQSRRQKLDKDNNLRGFYQWVQNNMEPKRNLLNPNYRYYGEWLVSHKIKYKEEYYDNFYLFSIWDEEKQEYLSDDIVKYEANKLGISTVPYLYEGKFISFEHLMSFVGKSQMTLEENDGEGIVVKNANYKNRNGEQCFVKLVTEKFTEIKKQRPPKNPNVDSEKCEIIKSVLTKPRVDKMMYKLIDEGLLKKEDFCIEQMGKLLRLLGSRIKEDILKEEYEIVKTLEEKEFGKFVGKTLPLVVKEVLKDYENEI